MAWYDWLLDRINHESKHLIYQSVDPEKTDTNTPTVQLEAGKHYFRLWLAEMYLKDDLKWFQEWYPAVHSLVRLQFGSQTVDVPNIAGSLNLEKIKPESINNSVQLNYPMTTLMPFNGGVVEITAGLLAIKGRNYLNSFIGIMGSFANLLVVPQLSTALAIAAPITDGIQQLLGNAEAGAVKIGLYQAFTGAGGGGANDFKSGYIFVISAENKDGLNRNKIWVKEGQIRYGSSLADSKPLKGYSYMLFRIESRTERDDYLSLSNLADPFNKAIEALAVDDKEKAESFLRAAVVAALQSADLTRADRSRVAKSLKAEYDEAKQNLGLGAVEVEKRGMETSIKRITSIDADEALSEPIPTFAELFSNI